MSEKNTELVEYYKNLLIMQYRDKPKALAHIDNIVRSGMIYDIAIAVRDGFNLDTAKGKQLDVLGRILGPSRTITGTTFTRAYYGYMLYGDTAPFTFNPMLLYGAEAGDVQFRNYTEGQQSLYDLTDEEYRVILKLAVVRNSSNASVKSIDDILYVLFGAECYFIDRMNMTVVSYMVGKKWSRIFQIAKSSGLLPNPVGVGTSLVVVPDINNIFAYSLYGGAKPTFAVGYGMYPEMKELATPIETTNELFTNKIAIINATFLIIPIQQKYIDTFEVFSISNNAFSRIGIVEGREIKTEQGVYSLTTLHENIFCCVDYLNSIITSYNYQNGEISQVGNSFSSGWLSRIVSRINNSEIIIGGGASISTISILEFSGTDWTEKYQTDIGTTVIDIANLSDNLFVVLGYETIKLYSYNGSEISLVSSTNIEKTYFSITAISDKEIVVNTVGGQIDTYVYSSSVFTKGSLSMLSGGHGYIQSLVDNEIILPDYDNQELRLIDVDYKNVTGCMASYS